MQAFALPKERAAGAGEVPVVVGGIIPPEDARALKERGVAAVFTPKDYKLTEMMDEIVTLAIVLAFLFVWPAVVSLRRFPAAS